MKACALGCRHRPNEGRGGRSRCGARGGSGGCDGSTRAAAPAARAQRADGDYAAEPGCHSQLCTVGTPHESPFSRLQAKKCHQREPMTFLAP